MTDITDIVTKMGDGNRLMGDLIQTISDRADSWNLVGTLPIIEGGTGATTAGDARANLGLVIGTDVQAYNASALIKTIAYVIDGGGAPILTGVAGDLWIPFACTINQVVMLADQSGSIVVDIWADEYANFPPDNSDSITSATPPTISATTKSSDSTLSGWTTSIAAGDTLRFNVDSASTVQRVTLSLKVTLV